MPGSEKDGYVMETNPVLLYLYASAQGLGACSDIFIKRKIQKRMLGVNSE